MDEKRERRWIPGEKADYVKELVEIINQEERWTRRGAENFTES